jgi:hypothetical protein
MCCGLFRFDGLMLKTFSLWKPALAMTEEKKERKTIQGRCKKIRHI